MAGCPHLKDFKKAGGSFAYGLVQQFLRQVAWEHSVDGKKNPEGLPTLKCTDCGTVTGHLHVCVHCVHFSCKEEHLAKHYENTKHGFAVDTHAGELYCQQCKDYIYDDDLDASFDSSFGLDPTAESPILVSPFADSALFGRLNRRRPEVDPDDIPLSAVANVDDQKDSRAISAEEQAVIDGHSTPYDVNPNIQGLRGMANLGSTCFMSCILQVFVHCPLIRNYFLSDMHNRTKCTESTSAKPTPCLCCEMDRLHEKMFSGKAKAFIPHHFLYSMWKCAEQMAGYEQQDAHEFFISLVDGMHKHSNGVFGGETKHIGDDCDCIVHTAFCGRIKSSIKCLVCGTSSETKEPFFDIAVDINTARTKKPYEQESKRLRVMEDCHVNTLLGCLRRFTRPEFLGVEEKFRCEKCDKKTESTKQLTVDKAPVVLCIQIKRFEHHGNQVSRKIGEHVDFPLSLDLSLYLSHDVKDEEERHDMHRDGSVIYDLFAVVNHVGTLDQGHYTNFVRHNSGWYKFDDTFVTKVTERNVLESEGYLLFYIQKEYMYNGDKTS